jgi:hypothetical protein
VSYKRVAVVAAFAFVIGFRLQAVRDDSPARAATTLSPSGASALASDTSVQEAPKGISAPAFARVPALPALHRAPARPRKAKPAPVSPAAPVATAVPTPTPEPDQGFDVAAAPVATPVPTSGEVLHQTATSKKAKMIRPKPVVRVRGRLTRNGARITAMTVKAPRGVKIKASCSGRGCPTHRMTRNASKLTHLTKFEKTLRSGTRITIRISKPGGYITKVTVLEIRRGSAPMRRDGCLWPARKKLQRCPGD